MKGKRSKKIQCIAKGTIENPFYGNKTKKEGKRSQEGENGNPGKNWFGWRIRGLEDLVIELGSMEVKRYKPVQSL